MGPPRWLRFVERLFPSSNMVVIAGDEQVLVDTGYGSDLARTEGLLAERGIGPADLSLVVSTTITATTWAATLGFRDLTASQSPPTARRRRW